MNRDDLLRGWSPWSPADGLRWALVGLVGTLLAFVAWTQARGDDLLSDQIVWMSVAVIGLVVAAYGNVSWLLRARHAVISRRERLLPLDVPSTRVGPSLCDDVLVAGPGLRRYHRASCQLAVGKGWPNLDEARVDTTVLEPCGVCLS